MTDPAAPSAGESAPAPRPAPERRVNWGRRLVVGGICVVVALVLFLIGAQVIPRWWSHRIGDQVSGSSISGVGFGLFYGAVFTFVPLIVLWFAFRKRRRWKVWIALFAVAVILAAPNLFTLGIVVGSSEAAHDSERTLAVEAPYFRGSTLAGAIGAAVVFIGFLYVLWMRRQGKRTERRLRDEIRARDAAAEADTPKE